jgi:hypothetical protein
MGVSKKNRRKIHVCDRLFLWWIKDYSDDEGFWYINVVADDNKQCRFSYSLNEADLATLAESQSEMPMLNGCDEQTGKLCQPVITREIGGDHHAGFCAKTD